MTSYFVLFTQVFTKYRIDNGYSYIFLLNVFVNMQLVEYFLWKSIQTRNASSNSFYSKIGLLLLFVQPLASIMLIASAPLRYGLAVVYLLAVALYVVLKMMYNPFVFKTTVGKNNHLAWKWAENKGKWELFVYFWIFCLTAAAFTENTNCIPFALSTGFLILYYNLYKQDLTFGFFRIFGVTVLAIFSIYLCVHLKLNPFANIIDYKDEK